MNLSFGKARARVLATCTALLVLLPARLGWALEPIPQRFDQELAFHIPARPGAPVGPVQLLDLHDRVLRAFVDGHWLAWANEAWRTEPPLDPPAPDVFRIAGPEGRPVTVGLPWKDARQVVRSGPRQWIVATDAVWEISGRDEPRVVALPPGTRVHHAAADPGSGLWLAASNGLWHRNGAAWDRVAVLDPLGRDWSAANVLAVAIDATGRPWVATRAGVARRDATGWRCFEGRDGLPWNDFTSAAAGPGETVWFGTHLGVIRWDGRDFHYRQGPRWLPSDDVRQVVVDGAGHAWMATAGGVGHVGWRSMTLAEKAEHYEVEIERYIARTPYGYVAEAPLKVPGIRESANPQDSDNDGLWTAMYGAGECMAYGATGNADALRRARKAFEALRFLQVVTQGGKPAPDPGYVARTIRPVEWPDPNAGRIEGDREEQKRDALWKAYEPRWPRSQDGKWFWKGDTSSDELDGHFFFYALYHDLCAKDEAEKGRVRQVVKDLADHLVAHDFALVDVDGKPTRWAVYGPGQMNRNPQWWVERGLNSLSILSYLAVASHVTGDARYWDVAMELVRKHGYAQNLMFPKVHQGPGSGNQSDDEMAFMCFYNLIQYGRDPEVVNQARYSFFQYWATDSPELNPFFHFAHAAMNQGRSITSVWGRFPVSPWDGWLEDSRLTLQGFPLDRLNWSHRNSHRLDLVRLGQVHAKDLYQAEGHARGHRVGGKVLPVENRHFGHWNTDPWDLDYGGNGNELSAGTVFLLPYYMGLHHGYIAKPTP
ncbi:MAG: hypothetical protein WCR07_12065 [Verrucomicrobiota bacterium]|jgi:hypothetical protein